MIGMEFYSACRTKRIFQLIRCEIRIMDAGRLYILKEVNLFIKVEKNGTKNPKHSVGCLCNFM